MLAQLLDADDDDPLWPSFFDLDDSPVRGVRRVVAGSFSRLNSNRRLAANAELKRWVFFGFAKNFA
jgi:hypothetical protein